MPDLQLELGKISDEINQIEKELEGLQQEAWADGELDAAEEAEIEETRRMLDYAKDARRAIEAQIDQTTVAVDEDGSGFFDVITDVVDTVTDAVEDVVDTVIDTAKMAVGGDWPGGKKSSISGSVGRGGANGNDDTATVQTLLNDNGSDLAVDGLIGPKTIKAITAFQQAKFGEGSGLIEPGDQTWQMLTGGSASEQEEDEQDDDDDGPLSEEQIAAFLQELSTIQSEVSGIFADIADYRKQISAAQNQQ